MFRSYPEEAASENWLHECLVKTVQAIHNHVDAGTSPTDWKDCIPTPFKARLQRYSSIHDAIDAYAKALKKTKVADRPIVLALLSEQNRVAELLANVCDCRDNKTIPKKLEKAVKNLFYSGFKALSRLGIRDRQYDRVHKSLGYPECPFCGVEFFDSPMQVAEETDFKMAPREDLDHYLAFCHYALAGCNLQNLVPSCKKCNETYKHNADCLRDANGVRRKSFPLYVPAANIATRISVSFENSVPFAGHKSPLPQWVVTFLPDCNETSTWNDVFHVSERYSRDVLTYDTLIRWLGAFGKWCRDEKVDCHDAVTLMVALERYLRLLNSMNFAGREKLRTPTFEMLLKHCNDGNQRLVDLLCDYASQQLV
jgi:hypothetical protein